MKLLSSLCACGLATLTGLDMVATQAQTSSPTRLGAASNFSQGWNETNAQAALDLPLPRLRDSIRWEDVERTPGRYMFDRPATTWPDRLARNGAAVTLTLNWGNPLYDNGETPHSPEALAAFGRFAAAVTLRFPQIDTLEIGNEVNSGNFVTGLVKDAGLARRDAYHLAMVRAAAEAVHKVRPEVKILGGSTHSLPAGYLWPLLDLPGAEDIQGLAVHPYTTPIDQLPAQVGLLRGRGPAAALPLYVTEFGSQDAQRASDDLMRGYATLATLGTAEMDWYPFNERGDGLIPLVQRDGSLTEAGKAFRFVQSRLVGRVARDVSPDSFTFARLFGGTIEVVWGAPRTVTIDARKVTAYDATGARLAPTGLTLREDRALVLIGAEPLNSGSLVQFGCTPLVADSFYQFDYPSSGALRAAKDGFERFLRFAGTDTPFEVMPGQQRSGVLWTPYLGLADLGNLRLTADTIVPATGGRDNAVVHRYRAASDGHFRLRATFEVSPDSADGITVSIMLDGRELFARSGTAPVKIELPLTLRKGQALSFAVGPGGNARGDITRYRIQIFDQDRCANSPR
ncbi:hypothetical protein [Novosphingobium sp.]|uniref:hypothetical protein n=1 Tax=Novosphingobium sp. TaxID=1874826 RepID=UPI002FDB44F8